MKHLVKTLIGASTMVLVFGSWSTIPGTQKWKIKKAATAYIELGLKDGESIRWGSIRRKLHREVKGNTYTYAEVKYTIVSENGNTYKTLYLLLSENCDSLCSVSEENDSELNPRDGMSDKSLFNTK